MYSDNKERYELWMTRPTRLVKALTSYTIRGLIGRNVLLFRVFKSLQEIVVDTSGLFPTLLCGPALEFPVDVA